MNKRLKKIIFLTLSIFVLSIGGIGYYIVSHWVEKNVVTSVEEYETYFGNQGIHRTKNNPVQKKTGESYLVADQIFPFQLPKSAETEKFYYEYYNPWDPCYLSYLVYTCDEKDYEAEISRLKLMRMPKNYFVYGASEFKYPVMAVNASDSGYIYALADEEHKRLIYVELTYTNYFTDIDYEAVIGKEHLPTGFDAKKENPTWKERLKAK